MDSGVARKPIADMAAYRNSLKGRLDPTAASLQRIFDQVRANPRARRLRRGRGGEDHPRRALLPRQRLWHAGADRAARAHPRRRCARMGLDPRGRARDPQSAPVAGATSAIPTCSIARLQRAGALHRDCQRMVNQDRNVFAACMVACGDADALVTGETRNYFTAFEEVVRVIGPKTGSRIFGFALLISRGRSIMIADTTAHARPSGDRARRHRHAIGGARAPHDGAGAARGAAVAFQFRQSRRASRPSACARRWRSSTGARLDFEYDGEMSAEVALNQCADARPLSLLPPHRPGQRADHARPRQRQPRRRSFWSRWAAASASAPC